MVDSSRHYENPLPDFSIENALNYINFSSKTLGNNFRKDLESKIEELLKKLDDNKSEWIDSNDLSIYTGISGIAYLLYFYSRKTGKIPYLNKALQLIERTESRKIDKKSITFLTGEAGRLAIGAVVNHALENIVESRVFICRLRLLYDLSGETDCDELLYGRSGYLFSLLFVNRHICEGTIQDDLIKEVIKCILTSGQKYASENGLKTPLMYSWHGKEYLGGAHGLAGILYVLLQARNHLTESELMDLIKPSLDYLITLRFSSMNFPSSIGNESDRLVHWCHGAPSMTMLFRLAFQVFGDDKYLKIAKDCGEVIWQRGLLRKGCGICHGTSGNAYTFLDLYQQTQEVKYLYRAMKFAEWCFDYVDHQNRIPDRPFSLFEGLAGIIHLLIDLRTPLEAKFPCYTL